MFCRLVRKRSVHSTANCEAFFAEDMEKKSFAIACGNISIKGEGE